MYSVPQIKFLSKDATLSFYTAVKIRQGSAFRWKHQISRVFQRCHHPCRQGKKKDVFETVATEHQQSKNVSKGIHRHKADGRRFFLSFFSSSTQCGDR